MLWIRSLHLVPILLSRNTFRPSNQADTVVALLSQTTNEATGPNGQEHKRNRMAKNLVCQVASKSILGGKDYLHELYVAIYICCPFV